MAYPARLAHGGEATRTTHRSNYGPGWSTWGKRFPDEAIARANELRAAVTPELVRVIDDLADDQSPADDPKYVLHFYAMHLLAQRRELAACRLLVKLGHLDQGTLESLLGDTVTETFSSCLASVCDGDPGNAG